jgi:putative DNA primase/helicase
MNFKGLSTMRCTHRFSAEAIATALDGRPRGEGWMACCPAHDDTTPSLSIDETSAGRVLVNCFAGCSQASVIAALRRRGLWPGHSQHMATEPDARQSNEPDRLAQALAIWNSALATRSTLAETYAARRGITIPLPQTIRFHPRLRHTPTGLRFPAIIALVVDMLGEPVAIHRTFLASDGRDKAPVPRHQQKMALGRLRGGAVRLAEPEPNEVLAIAEGLETGLSILQVQGLATWVSVGTAGLKQLVLPPCVRDVIIAADGDAAGEAAARSAALRWMREGRRVRIARPPKEMDFNDLLLRETVA